ncbi:MAG: carbohydrate kinase [Spirochaetaceae bacterium]|jgi:fructokinase|nr:carbohydrate kinase [Spirochaetaceae bacterium]
MILCCGEALIDMIPAPSGGGDGFIPRPGGSPYNTAVAIGRLGTPVRFFGRLSTDFFGEMLIRRLSQDAVGTDLIIRSGENSTLAFVRLEPGREPAYVFYTQGSADSSLSPGDLPPRLPPEIRCILFGSISMTMEPVASAIETLIFRESAPQGPVISLDPNIRPFMIRDRDAYVKRFECWVAASTIVKISKADFDFIYPGLGPEKSLAKILTMGPRMALTTLGAGGARALLLKEGGTVLDVSAPVVDLPVADTIGAGDTFHGAFLSWLERKGKMSREGLLSFTEKELYEALFFANKAASLVCSRHGADPPSLAEVEALER